MSRRGSRSRRATRGSPASRACPSPSPRRTRQDCSSKSTRRPRRSTARRRSCRRAPSPSTRTARAGIGGSRSRCRMPPCPRTCGRPRPQRWTTCGPDWERSSELLGIRISSRSPSQHPRAEIQERGRICLERVPRASASHPPISPSFQKKIMLISTWSASQSKASRPPKASEPRSTLSRSANPASSISGLPVSRPPARCSRPPRGSRRRTSRSSWRRPPGRPARTPRSNALPVSSLRTSVRTRAPRGSRPLTRARSMRSGSFRERTSAASSSCPARGTGRPRPPARSSSRSTRRLTPRP